jgi:predicted nucleotide-binding protein
MAKKVKIVPPPPIPRKTFLGKLVELTKKEKPGGEGIPKETFSFPAVQHPTPPPEAPIELLKKQEADGQAILKTDFLSLEKSQHWNTLTRDMLAMVFGLDPGFIDAVLYASEQQVYSMYEPESKLEKQRRKFFEASLRMLEICIEEFGLNKGLPKSEINEKIKNRVALERKAITAQNQEEEKKELGLRKEPLKPNIVKGGGRERVPEIREIFTIQGPDEGQRGPKSSKMPFNPEVSEEVEVTEASENGGVSTAQGDDEGKRHPKVDEDLPTIDLTEEIENTESSEREKGSLTPGFAGAKKSFEPNAEAFKPDIDKRMESMETSEGRKVFIVHGNDEKKKEAVAALLAKMELEPVILHEQPGHAMALIEKFEQYGDVVFAIIILTGDDYGYAKGKPEESKPRPRQNVVFELGFLIGRFQGQHVCALHEEGLEMPSDYKGAVFIPYDAGGIWKLLVARAMKTANLNVDLNKAV